MLRQTNRCSAKSSARPTKWICSWSCSISPHPHHRLHHPPCHLHRTLPAAPDVVALVTRRDRRLFVARHHSPPLVPRRCFAVLAVPAVPCRAVLCCVVFVRRAWCSITISYLRTSEIGIQSPSKRKESNDFRNVGRHGRRKIVLCHCCCGRGHGPRSSHHPARNHRSQQCRCLDCSIRAESTLNRGARFACPPS